MRVPHSLPWAEPKGLAAFAKRGIPRLFPSLDSIGHVPCRKPCSPATQARHDRHPSQRTRGSVPGSGKPFWSTILRLANPLPQYVGSLSKYIRAEKYYELLSSITHDIPESHLRAKSDPNLFATAKAPYLLVEKGMVRRDELVHLIHDEGAFSERVKMVMYFLFMFRDRRYREFICNVVGQRKGYEGVFRRPFGILRARWRA